MKNVVKFLSLALVAGAMLVSCGGEKFTITAEPNDATMGTVTGGGEFKKDATTTLTATPNAGYLFVQWQDGNTDNPRTVTVTANATYTATFAPEQGVKVTFGSDTWKANEVLALDATAQAGVFAMGAWQTKDGYPYLMAQATTTVGNYTATYDASSYALSNDKIGFFDYYKETSLQSQDGSTFGDNWADNITLNVTAYDANSLKLSFNASGKMFNAKEAYVDQAGYEAATRTDFTCTVSNIDLTPYGKALPSNNGRNGALKIVK